MGQKDDTRENSCVTESKRERQRMGEMGEQGDGGREGKRGEKEIRRTYGSVTTSQKAKSHTISIF